MASGISLEMRYMTRDAPVKPRETRARDRSLPGKARVQARKAANKVGVVEAVRIYDSSSLAGMNQSELRAAGKALGMTKYTHLKVGALRDAIYDSSLNRA